MCLANIPILGRDMSVGESVTVSVCVREKESARYAYTLRDSERERETESKREIRRERGRKNTENKSMCTEYIRK